MFLYNREQLSQYLKQVFILLFQRLTSSKTTKYVKGELLFVTGEVSFFRAGDFLPARMLFSQGIEKGCRIFCLTHFSSVLHIQRLLTYSFLVVWL